MWLSPCVSCLRRWCQAFRSYLTWKFINKTLLWTSEWWRACVRPTLFTFCFNICLEILKVTSSGTIQEKNGHERTHHSRIHNACVRRRPTVVKNEKSAKRTLWLILISRFSLDEFLFGSVVRLSVGCQSVSRSNIIIITDYFINFIPHSAHATTLNPVPYCCGRTNSAIYLEIMICWWPIECARITEGEFRSGNTMVQHRIEPAELIWYEYHVDDNDVVFHSTVCQQFVSLQ